MLVWGRRRRHWQRPLVSDTALTIVVGVVGVLASIVVSVLAYQLGSRQARRQHAELVKETADSRAEMVAATDRQASALMRTIEDTFGSVEEFVAILEAGASETLASPRGARLVQERPRARADRLTTELLIRSSLGRLVNERGELHMQRLLDEVAATLRKPSHQAVVAALQHMRDQGAVSWEGPSNLAGVEVISVRTYGARRKTSRAGEPVVTL